MTASVTGDVSKQSVEVSASDIDQVLKVFMTIRENADGLNCAFIDIGSYWAGSGDMVIPVETEIAVGIADFDDYQINQELAEKLGLELSLMGGKTYAQKKIFSGKSYSKKKNAVIIEQVHERILDLYPEGFDHLYERNMFYKVPNIRIPVESVISRR